MQRRNSGTAKTRLQPKWGASVWGNIPDWLLALVGVFTFFAVIKQAVETKNAALAAKESAKSTRDSVELQKAALRQWVALTKWRNAGVGFWEPTQVFFEKVLFSVTNTTNYRLDIFSVEVHIVLGENNGSFAIKRPPDRPDFLPPGGDFEVGLEIILPNAKRNSVGEVSFQEFERIINVSVGFRDVLGRMENQHLAMVCEFFSERKTEFKSLSNRMERQSEQGGER